MVCTNKPLEDEDEGRDGGGADEVPVGEEDEGAHPGVEGELGEKH